MTDTPANKPLIPSITGNPLLDTLLRGALLAGSAYVTAILVTWANAHGFTGPNVSLEIGAAVLSTMVTVAVFAWSFIQTKLNQLSVAQHVITTQATGVIPENVKIAAIKAPSISEVEITKALNNAEATKASQ